MNEKEISTIRQVICTTEQKVHIGEMLGLLRLYKLDDGQSELTYELAMVRDIVSFWGEYARVSVRTFEENGMDRHTAEYWIPRHRLVILPSLTYKTNNIPFNNYQFKLDSYF